MIAESPKAERDSFEEVDRILTIVEESKVIYDKARRSLFAFLWLFLASNWILATFLYIVVNYGDNQLKSTPFLYLPLIVASYCMGILVVWIRLKEYKSSRKNYEQTALYGVDAVREAIPVLAAKESWSPLRKFELNLRLSKLGISELERFRKRSNIFFEEPAVH